MISGWGEGRVCRFSLECNYLKNHVKPVVAYLQRLHSVLASFVLATHLPRPEIDGSFIVQASLLS